MSSTEWTQQVFFFFVIIVILITPLLHRHRPRATAAMQELTTLVPPVVFAIVLWCYSLTDDSCAGIGITLRCCLFVNSCGHIQVQQLRITLKRHQKTTLFRTNRTHVRHSKWKLEYKRHRIINIHEMHNTPLFRKKTSNTHSPIPKWFPSSFAQSKHFSGLIILLFRSV